MELSIVNYQSPDDRQALVALLNAYAQDPIGGGEALTLDVQARLCDALAQHPGAYSFLVRNNSEPVGLLNAFTGFSTFKAMPLINIHDVYVAPHMRGKGVLQMLFEAVELKAIELGCCKLTLEVLQENYRAQGAYRRQGFKGYDLGEAGGEALFWQKKIS